MGRRNILVVYYSDPLGLHTIQDNVQSFQLLSTNNIILLNTYPKAQLPSDLNLSHFDGIVIDSTLAYFPKTLEHLDDNIPIKLKDFDGVKILLKQDEHVHSHATARLIGQKKIDVVFTCLEESQIPKVYPSHLVGEVQFVQQLTGYLSDTLITLANSFDYTRCIDISYRGSIQPLQCGRLGYEKWSIGDSVSKKLFGKSVKTDIAYQWADRIHGKDWIKFLSCSKGVLGVESGSNIFDFTGDVEKLCLAFEQNNSALKENPEAFYQKAQAEFLSKYEDNVTYGQISPRHFEAAATRTLQILYEGDYSHIFVPYKHYLPLKRDLSNLEEIQEILFNSSKRSQITDCAYEEIVMNEKFHYKRRVEQCDRIIENIAVKKNVSPSTANHNLIKSKKNIIVLVPHEPHLDPRINWLKEGFDDFANTSVVGITKIEKSIKWRISNEYTVEANLNYSGLSKLTDDYEESVYGDYYGLKRLLSSFGVKGGIKFPESSFYSPESINRFRWCCDYFKKTDQALRFLTEQLITANATPPSVLVCCDLPSLLPAVILAQKYHLPLVYDAHEFWAYSDVDYLPWEVDFWLYYESVLLRYVDFPITVSKTLAEKMSSLYLTNFSYIPNTETAKNHRILEEKQLRADLLLDDCAELPDFTDKSLVTFLYMGGYAPGRGLEQLIDVWRSVPKNNKLIFRGVHRLYTDSLIARAKGHGLYNDTVFFFKPVTESELVSMASAFDVGIIPYDQNINLVYKYCCPNKLSQYMAAGIPILSNQLVEVERVINQAHCGFVVNFNVEQEMLDVIHQLGDASLRKQMGHAARKYFLSEYNWEKQAESLNNQLKTVTEEKSKARFLTLSIRNLPEASIQNIPEVNTHNVPEISVHNLPEATDQVIPSLVFGAIKKIVTRRIKIFNPILRQIRKSIVQNK